jgi:hypothetical protein
MPRFHSIFNTLPNIMLPPPARHTVTSYHQTAICGIDTDTSPFRDVGNIGTKLLYLDDIRLDNKCTVTASCIDFYFAGNQGFSVYTCKFIPNCTHLYLYWDPLTVH